jgi:hypothetical protein
MSEHDLINQSKEELRKYYHEQLCKDLKDLGFDRANQIKHGWYIISYFEKRSENYQLLENVTDAIMRVRFRIKEFANEKKLAYIIGIVNNVIKQEVI